MNRQLVFIISIIIFLLPWPQVGIPGVLKLIIIDVCALILILQAVRKPKK
jgi:hypothetical protein